MATVGSRQQGAFPTPINGTSPIDANEVRLNDNAMAATYNTHDADATIHVQSSLLALRPVPGLQGRLWWVTDEQRWYYDDGSNWLNLTLDGGAIDTGTIDSARLSGPYTGITETGTLTHLDVTGLLSVLGGITGDLTGDVTGDLTGDVTGNVSGSAGSAAQLTTARTVALTGDVVGSISTDFSGTTTITVTYDGIVPVAKGGTGVGTAPADGELLIGDTGGFSLAKLTAGANISINNTAGGIEISATGSAAGVTGTGSVGYIPVFDAVTNVKSSLIRDNGSAVGIGAPPDATYKLLIDSLRLVTGDVMIDGVAYVFPPADGNNGDVLSTDGSGNLSWLAGAADLRAPAKLYNYTHFI